MYTVVYTKKAVKDIPLLKAAGWDGKARALIEILRGAPLSEPTSV